MPTPIFCLHALGSSSREFDLLRDLLADRLELIGLDLPGFGGSAALPGFTVEEMSAHVEDAIRSHGATEWALLGHSLGGKVASVVAGRTMDGSNGLFGLRAVVLLAASPLSPEPMSDERRQSMLAWAQDVTPFREVASNDARAAGIGLAHAHEFITANTAAPLSPDRDATAVDDVLRTSARAWAAWLRHGSREDWSRQFAPNPVPALVLAGAQDGDLDADAQRELTLPRWTAAELHEVPGAAHLLPWERPDEVASLVRDFWDRRVRTGPSVPPAWARLIASERVSSRTRRELAARALPDDPARSPRALDDTQLETLRVLAAHAVPQPGPDAVDLALRVDDQLARGSGDGWRPDGSPADVVAYRAALDELRAAADGAPEDVAAVLDRVAAGTFPTVGAMGPEQLRAWWEDATVDLVRQWIGHPATMAALDYDGFATGGDRTLVTGFGALGGAAREEWEPPPPRRPLPVVSGAEDRVRPTCGGTR
ncbi:alpha/beta fold hydrolase [Kineococcus rhizosphaerae]|uniref:Pimeloyl-ACP methyl ester carboxylesterase n=1 Tax=Kineococcus rhizosphaerae TaxID=559628 RepID=A0A2T0R3G5_9ACTN|nr:alpha/beta hydrolase [Kineococcus rhizosphaerae]PRY14618.1 pimeloyl-ACP methyl ester carboxylesterase [Kineococcus rhizosphaerae]